MQLFLTKKRERNYVKTRPRKNASWALTHVHPPPSDERPYLQWPTLIECLFYCLNLLHINSVLLREHFRNIVTLCSSFPEYRSTEVSSHNNFKKENFGEPKKNLLLQIKMFKSGEEKLSSCEAIPQTKTATYLLHKTINFAAAAVPCYPWAVNIGNGPNTRYTIPYS